MAGVIGTPISHSKSPVIHGYWLKHHSVKGHYVPLDVSRKDFKDVVGTLGKMGFRGVNVTIPHKETAIRYADGVSDNASIIGAANTLTFRPDGSVYADNTDGYGFIQNLKERAPGWSAKTGPALVLGAGGAARAVIYALLLEGTPEVYLSNRTKERAEMLRSDFGNRVKVVDSHAVGEVLPRVSILVNTTSLGMKGQPPLRLPMEKLSGKTLVSDIVYSPLQTELLRGAARKGCSVVDGLGMLLHQAANAFYFWYGTKPDVNWELRELVLKS